MKSIRDYIQDNPNHVIGIPAVLCFCQFISNAFDIVRTGHFDTTAINQLMSSADGFESVSLFLVMLALRGKKGG